MRAVTVRACLLALALAAGALHAPARAAASAEDLQILDLQVEGGSGWHPRDAFYLRWGQLPGAPAPAAAYYRLYDSAGAPLGPAAKSASTGSIQNVFVPEPGEYRIDVWLEAANGETGPRESARLRFDDVAPGDVSPTPAAAWFAGDERDLVGLSHPDSVPVSGIRGYAVSIDRGEGSSPCPTGICALGETDLAGGIGGDEISLGPLPEGVSYVRAVAVSGAGVPSAEVESAEVLVDAMPPRLTLHGLPDGWARGPVEVTAAASDALSGMSAAGPGGPFTAISVDGAAPSRSPGGSASTLVSGEGVHRVDYFARDAAGNVADGRSGTAAPATATVRIDASPPRVAFAAAQDPRDPERLEATVSDALSGADPGRGSISVRPLGSDSRFRALPTTPAGDGRLIARWDSDSYPPGTYEFRALGFDRAGNEGMSSKRADGIKMVLRSPLKERVRILAGLGGRRTLWRRCRRRPQGRRCGGAGSIAPRPGRVALPYGRGIGFGGLVLASDGSPVPAAPIKVIERFSAGAEPASRQMVVRTDRQGRFFTRLEPGPSREVSASFAGSRLLGRTESETLRLAVSSGVRLRASRASARVGGPPVVFAGRLLTAAAKLPPAGRPVELQFRYPGAGWSEFRTVQTNARGRFRYAYSFSDDDSRGVRFQFRAYVPPLEGWPYEPAASRPVAVTGR